MNQDMPREAGRRLDILVAKQVMGWKLGRRYGNGGQEWASYREMSGVPMTVEHTPQFSTDIGAAWRVVETLTDDRGSDVMWRAEFFKKRFGFESDNQFVEFADTAPLAICLAALKAVEAGASVVSLPEA